MKKIIKWRFMVLGLIMVLLSGCFPKPAKQERFDQFSKEIDSEKVLTHIVNPVYWLVRESCLYYENYQQWPEPNLYDKKLAGFSFIRSIAKEETLKLEYKLLAMEYPTRMDLRREENKYVLQIMAKFSSGDFREKIVFDCSSNELNDAEKRAISSRVAFYLRMYDEWNQLKNDRLNELNNNSLSEAAIKTAICVIFSLAQDGCK